jgi:excisionase family DNA binding protein
MTSEENPENNWSFRESVPNYIETLTKDRIVRKMFDLEVEKFYTTDEVAEKLNIEKEVIRDLIRKSELYAIKIGKSYRITDSDLQEFLIDRYTRNKRSEKAAEP